MSGAIQRYQQIVTRIDTLASGAHSELEFDQRLRIQRHQAWIVAAEKSSAGLDPIEVCKDWSKASDSILIAAFRQFFDPEKYLLIAYGKLGSFELNISSDVDLLILSTSNESEDFRPALRGFQKLISENTSLGFCHRIDFDLRPGGRQGSLVPSVDEFEDYYANHGETWERLAMIRLRILAGPEHAKVRLENFVRRFIWRKHLDFTLMEDLKLLRGKIQGLPTASASPNSFHLKMAPGGIRDVELFTHALQVVHGGKVKALQTVGIVETLEQLNSFHFLGNRECEFLKNHYRELRRLENFVQSLEDQQTHSVPLIDESFWGVVKKWTPIENGTPSSPQSLIEHCRVANEIVSEILGRSDEFQASPPVGDELVESIWHDLEHIRFHSKNRSRDLAIRKKFISEFVSRVQRNEGDLFRSLQHLKEFLINTRSKTSFFDLLLHQPALFDELAWLFGHASYLANLLCHRPEILDSFIFRSQAEPSLDWESLLPFLVEKKVLNELISGADYLRTKDLPRLLQANTSTATEVTQYLLTKIHSEISSEIYVEPLGKWGGCELGLRSDLDFALISKSTPSVDDHKAGRRFIHRLTEQHHGGAIYSVDLRLRPSGSSGPLIVEESQLIEWLETEAEAWQRQAWLKSKKFQQHCLKKDLTESELSDLWNIQQELFLKVDFTQNHLDLKYSPGGLLDIELFTQAEILLKKHPVQNTSTFDFLQLLPDHVANSRRTLTECYFQLRQIEQILQLVSTHSISCVHENHECLPLLAKAMGKTSEDVLNEIQDLFRDSLHCLNKLDPRRLSQ